ncbi:MAG: molecular chaperone [Clostridia bacterium]
MALTNYERETIINLNEEEKTASIYTYNVKLINRINKKVREYPDLYKIVAVDQHGGITCEMPKDKLSICLLGKISDEVREKRSNFGKQTKSLENYRRSKQKDKESSSV